MEIQRKEGEITNDTNKRIARMICAIRPFVKFVINLFFSVKNRKSKIKNTQSVTSPCQSSQPSECLI
jgi:hypothetical protein